MAQSVYDLFSGLLGIDAAEQQRRSLERAIGRAPNDIRRDAGGILGSASMSRTPARAQDYPEVAAAVRGSGFRPQEIQAALGRRAEIGQKAAGYSADIPSVMQLTPNEIRAIGAQGAAQNIVEKFGPYFGMAADTAKDLMSYAAGDSYELEGARVGREASDAAQARKAALDSQKTALSAAKKVQAGKVDDLTEDEKKVAQEASGAIAQAGSAASGVGATQAAPAQAGLLGGGAQSSSLSGLLGGIGQNAKDFIMAYGALQAASPQLVTADDLDKLRPISGPMVLAQAEKMKEAREARDLAAYSTATKQMKERLALLKQQQGLSAEDDKKLQREAESVMDARQNVGFIDEALSLIDGAYDYGALPTGLAQFGASMSSGVAGTAAYDLESVLTTLRARIGFDKLQEMRQNSPTGGALGQVSDFENRLLQATEGNLTLGVDPDRMRASLLDIRDAQMAMVHGIVDNTGRLRRLESRGDLERLRNGEFRVAGPRDIGRSSGSTGVRQFNRQTGNIE